MLAVSLPKQIMDKLRSWEAASHPDNPTFSRVLHQHRNLTTHSDGTKFGKAEIDNTKVNR